MPTWSDLQDELQDIRPERRGDFVVTRSHEFVTRIATHYQRNVLFYASSFLQKPRVAGAHTSISMEDVNGFMACLHGHDNSKGLLLILHTPGGSAEAAQTIVGYLRNKYQDIDVLVPTYAMSAGTMIALGCDRIVMGRQSQLGPTDPQLFTANQSFSAHSIVAQFEEAKREITEDPVLAHAWAPILSSFGPALLEEARQSLAYGQEIVQGWLEKYMFADRPDAAGLAEEVARYFCGRQHGSHGRRIGRKEARSQHLNIVNLEDDQDLQDDVLTLYHLTTIAFEQGPAFKSVISSNGRMWVRNFAGEAGEQVAGRQHRQ